MPPAAEDELRGIEAALEEFDRRCAEVGEALQRNQLTLARDLYKALKADLEEAARPSRMSSTKHPRTWAQAAYFDQGVRKALQELRPATNTNPVTSNWKSAVSAASFELAYQVNRLRQAHFPAA